MLLVMSGYDNEWSVGNLEKASFAKLFLHNFYITFANLYIRVDIINLHNVMTVSKALEKSF